ncbi:MAG TPA: prepilin-type N-terminal cleavage/methylation domain-containing protein [Opitutaceae bacterium]|nr:prepilin-type N-terminal cleavage/methylation domain-containing protein [Opitutaceae bacterium]HVT55565.1 prepilin-type N-terminal cleavage/methylation domain-containing protein [Xanthobacteraceae bacterium]
MKDQGPRTKDQGAETKTSFRRAARRGFTLLEILLALALVSLVLIAMNAFVFSMGELWGRGTDVRLFDQHVGAVTRFLEHELRAAVLPPAARANSTPLTLQEIRPESGLSENMLTFDLPGGSRFFNWSDRPLPEVVCSFQVRPSEGLIILWHSRLEKNFDTDPPRESVVTPLVTALAYDYYDPATTRWTTETTLKLDPQGQPMTPQRLRLTFTYGKLTRESVVPLPSPSQALPAF